MGCSQLTKTRAGLHMPIASPIQIPIQVAISLPIWDGIPIRLPMYLLKQQPSCLPVFHTQR